MDGWLQLGAAALQAIGTIAAAVAAVFAWWTARRLSVFEAARALNEQWLTLNATILQSPENVLTTQEIRTGQAPPSAKEARRDAISVMVLTCLENCIVARDIGLIAKGTADPSIRNVAAFFRYNQQYALDLARDRGFGEGVAKVLREEFEKLEDRGADVDRARSANPGCDCGLSGRMRPLGSFMMMMFFIALACTSMSRKRRAWRRDAARRHP